MGPSVGASNGIGNLVFDFLRTTARPVSEDDDLVFAEVRDGINRRAQQRPVTPGSGDRQQEIIKFPNVLIFFRPMQAPTGGSIGTTVNHIGFSVPDLRPLVAKIRANGFKMITADSVAANVKVTDDIAAASPTTNLAFALGPEDVKVEFVEVKSQKAPIQLHHIHFFGQMNTEMQAWYATTFGATMLPANPGSAFVQDQLPGVFLNFTPSPTPTAGTTGRSIDHIGFEIKNLEAFTKKLEAQGIKLDRP